MRLESIFLAVTLGMLPVLPAHGDDSPAPEIGAPVDIDLENGRKAIEAKDWKLAIAHLDRAASRDAANADTQNLLGYAWRKSGNLDRAFRHYGAALKLNPKHRGAHEYVGEAYLMINNLSKAEEHLAALDKLCFLPCEEYTDLKEAIAAYRRTHR